MKLLLEKKYSGTLFRRIAVKSILHLWTAIKEMGMTFSTSMSHVPFLASKNGHFLEKVRGCCNITHWDINL